jgi:hypothetical protein
MAKIIKLTENDLTNIVKKVIEEQETGVKPYPIPQEQIKPNNDKNIPPFPEKKDDSSNMMNKKYETQADIVVLKRIVKAKLNSTLDKLENLIKISGINPESNGLIPMLEKLIAKFDTLYGDPKPAEGINEYNEE